MINETYIKTLEDYKSRIGSTKRDDPNYMRMYIGFNYVASFLETIQVINEHPELKEQTKKDAIERRRSRWIHWAAKNRKLIPAAPKMNQ